MTNLPEVVAMTLCDRMEVNPQTGKVSLIGVFQALHYSAFPTPPQKFIVCTTLFGGRGEGAIELAIARMETEADIARYRRWWSFPQRRLNVNLMIPFTRCVFPCPGRYELQLCFDKQELTHRYLDIFQE